LIVEYKDVNVRIEGYGWKAVFTIIDKKGNTVAKYIVTPDMSLIGEMLNGR